MRTSAKPPCCVPQCDRTAKFIKDRLCEMHYFRRMRNGHYGLKRVRRERWQDDRGYWWRRIGPHPLSDDRGLAREHRYVYYTQIDSAPSACALCAAPINWGSLHIDHIDNDPSNNEASNLRALCRPCNVYRGHTTTSLSKHLLEINGIVMDAQGWARQPGVTVCGNTILRRKKAGMSDFDAVYSPRLTHHSTQTKKPQRKYDAMRGIAEQERRLT